MKHILKRIRIRKNIHLAVMIYSSNRKCVKEYEATLLRYSIKISLAFEGISTDLTYLFCLKTVGWFAGYEMTYKTQ